MKPAPPRCREAITPIRRHRCELPARHTELHRCGSARWMNREEQHRAAGRVWRVA